MNPVLIQPEVSLPGFHLVVAHNDVQPVLTALPQFRTVPDSVASAGGPAVLVYQAPDLDMEVLASVIRIEPTFMGRNYRFAA